MRVQSCIGLQGLLLIKVACSAQVLVIVVCLIRTVVVDLLMRRFARLYHS